MRIVNTFMALWGLSVFGAEVRVRVQEGVPQIQVDGQPVRSRWFWGGPTSSAVSIKAGEQWLELERLPLAVGTNNVTFHFRFDQKPTTIWLDRFEVIDAKDGSALVPLRDFAGSTSGAPEGWNYHPQDERNTVGAVSVDPHGGVDGGAALKIELKNPSAGGAWPDFHVYTQAAPMTLRLGHSYKIRFWLKSDTATTLSPGVYRPASPSFIQMMGDTRFQEQVKMAAEAGVDFISPPCPMPWPKPGEEPDWSAVDLVMRQILDVNPRAKVVPRIGMTPPAWWHAENPSELMEWREAKRAHGPLFSVSSLKWRRESCERLRLLIEYLDKTYPDHMAGYHPCGQNTGEWFYLDSWQQEFHGYSPCEQTAFRVWLQRKYGSDAALQTAWRDATVTIATAPVPSPQARRDAAAEGMLLLPGAAQPIIDHNLFLQDDMADAVLAMAKTIRDASQGRRLSVFFYGYGNEFASLGRMSAAGHLAMRKLLESPDIDILCSPVSYFDRELGGGGHAMTAAESVMKAGKLWLYEDDTRTHLAAGGSLGSLNYHAGNQWESRQILMRNTGQEIIRNLACWWMDLVRNAWYADPVLWADMRDLGPMEEAKLSKPRVYAPAIACVFDEYSAVYSQGGAAVTRPLLSHSRLAFSRLGAAFGQYFLDDVLAGRVDSRLLVLLNPWVLNDGQRQQLRQAVAGKFVLWCHAPGVIDPVTGVSLEASRSLTGYGLVRLEGESMPEKVLATSRGRELGLPSEWALPKGAKLLYAVQSAAGDELLATWPDGTAAVLLRHDSLFSASPVLPRELLRLAAQRAGVHLYTDDECVLYADGVNLLVHATQEGPVTLRFPEAVTVKNLLTGKSVAATAVQSLRLQLKKGETTILGLQGK